MRLNIIPKPNRIYVSDINSVKPRKTEYRVNPNLTDEEYMLKIDNGNVMVEYSTENGKYYANVTLLQIQNQFSGNVISCEIHDRPRYAYRGFMIDCARHFFSVEDLKKMITACALFKFNVFHWHLSDDQGFRIELDSHPEITIKGSVRESSDFGKVHRNEKYGGYYKKDEIREIVAFCKERFIDVIPEIDIPGHTSAIISAIPEISCTGNQVPVKTTAGIFKDIICPGKEKTYEILKDIFDEITELFPFEYIHIGGDEVPKNKWQKCPDCQAAINRNNLRDEEQLHAFVLNTFDEYLKQKGKKCIAWNDSLKGGNLNKDITVQLWMDNNDLTKKFADDGGKVLISDFYKYYVDYPLAMTPLKKTYTFEPKNAKGFKGAKESSILGVESPIWTEYIETLSQMGIMCFPRYAAVAESGWTDLENKNYNDFEMRLKGIAPMIKKAGIEYASLNECNPNPAKRISGTLKFFKRNISSELVRNFFFPNNND